mgnify:FL=1
MVEIISILFVDTYLWCVLSLVFCIWLLYALYVQYPSIKFQTTITVTVKAFAFLCLFFLTSLLGMVFLLIPTYIIGFSLLSFFPSVSESLYGLFSVIVFSTFLSFSLYSIYKKYHQKWWREMVWSWIKKFMLISGCMLLGLLIIVIEYLFDFRPNTNEIDLLNESMDMHYSQREVYNHYQWCWIPFTCKEYFRFYATREEVDELIQKQWFEEYGPETSYFYDIMYELQSQYIRRFHPSEDTILYYYAEIESYDLYLYYDANEEIAYLISSYMH